MENKEVLKIIKEAQAVLFDMDGVIIDTDTLHKDSKKGAIASCGVELSDDVWQELGHYTSAQIYRKLFEKYPDIKVTEKEFVTTKSRIFAEIAHEKIKEITGAFEFVNNLRIKGKKTALVTASRLDTLNLVAEKFDLKKYFDVILSADDVEHVKPHPEGYIKAANLLNVETIFCVVFEDAVPGIRSGKSAGCKVIGKIGSDNGGTLLDAGADAVFENYSEIL